jgi:methionine synthase I (cobalamin-dependent)
MSIAMTDHPFVRALGERALLLDGAMGTMLYERGVFITQCFEHQNLLKPRLVREIHGQYVHAGAEVIETNTFGANRLKLARHGIEGAAAQQEIIAAGVELAREAAGKGVWVAGSVGPAGETLGPESELEEEVAQEIFYDQIDGLAKAGVDLLVLETFRELGELEVALRRGRPTPDGIWRGGRRVQRWGPA